MTDTISPENKRSHRYPSKRKSSSVDDEGFTHKEKLFILCYLKDQNAAQALVAAGYNGKNVPQRAHDMLNKPRIKEYIDQQLAVRQKMAVEQLDVSFEWIANKLKYIACKCAPDGIEMLEPKQAQAAVGALSELNKMMGNYSPEKHMNYNVNVTKDPELDRAHELAKLYEKEY